MPPKAKKPSTQCWRVVGGADKGGIVVREGKDLTSAALDGRIATGAVVKELELAGDRLKYKKLKLKDAGPEEGWVSTKLPGKELLVRCEPPGPPDFNALIPQVAGTLEPSQRHLDGWTRPLGFERIANFRDVADSHPGGLPIPCADGKTLKKGLLFRSGHWAVATKRDVERLKHEIGIRTYIDLREGKGYEGADSSVYDEYQPGPHSRHKQTAVPQAGERRRIWCPFTKNLRMRSYSPDEQDNTVSECDKGAMVSWFQQWFNRKKMNDGLNVHLATDLSTVNRAILFINKDEVLKAMKTLTDRANFPLLFGCVAGKDRTGLMSCLILSALGVSEDLIMEDYLRTNRAFAHIGACAEAGIYMWWKEIYEQKPSAWQAQVQTGGANPMILRFGPAPEGAEDPFLRGLEAIGGSFGWEKFGWSREDVAKALAARPADPKEAEPAGQGGAAGGLQEALGLDEPADTEGQDASPTNAASSAENMSESKVYRGTMEYTFQMLREEGGALKYLERIGFGADDVMKLREILTE